MAQVLKSYLNTITNLEETINKEVDGILRVIDVDQLLDNPEAYMQEIS